MTPAKGTQARAMLRHMLAPYAYDKYVRGERGKVPYKEMIWAALRAAHQWKQAQDHVDAIEAKIAASPGACSEV